MATYRLPLVDSRNIIFKSLSAEDADRYYQALLTSNSNTELEEYIFNLITEDKYLDQIKSLDAGIILSVIYASFSLSNVIVNVKDFPTFIEEARSKADSLYSVLYTKIARSMPYKLEELKQKSLNELLELFVMAENISEKPIDLNKMREILNVTTGSKKKQKKANVSKDQLDALTKHLNSLEQSDFDANGRFIGDGNLM